jgi:hypothetical protein
MTAVSIDDLLAGQTPGYTLPQAFHLDPDVYRLELERIWRRGWLLPLTQPSCAMPATAPFSTPEMVRPSS